MESLTHTTDQQLQADVETESGLGSESVTENHDTAASEAASVKLSDRDLTVSEAVEATVEAEASPSLSETAVAASAAQVTPLMPNRGRRAFAIADRMAAANTLENLYQLAVAELRLGRAHV